MPRLCSRSAPVDAHVFRPAIARFLPLRIARSLFLQAEASGERAAAQNRQAEKRLPRFGLRFASWASQTL